jgi:hypothetical protein
MVRKWRNSSAPEESVDESIGVVDLGRPNEPNGPIEEFVSRGWQTADEALAWLYGSASPHQVNYPLPAALGVHLQGCSAYPAAGFWHYVTYGLSDQFTAAPRPDDEALDWALELTLRIPRADEDEPPLWPFTVIGELVSRINAGSLHLQAGARIDLRRAVTGHPSLADAPETNQTVFAVAVDPQLGRVSTRVGVVHFLQLVGVTEAEKQRMIESSTAGVLDKLAGRNPLLITDPART